MEIESFLLILIGVFFLVVAAYGSFKIEKRSFGFIFLVLFYLLLYSFGAIDGAEGKGWVLPVFSQLLGILILLLCMCFVIFKVDFDQKYICFSDMARLYFGVLFAIAVVSFFSIFILYGYQIFTMTRMQRMLVSDTAPVLSVFKFSCFSAYCYFLIEFNKENKGFIPLLLLAFMGVLFSIFTVSRGTLVLFIFPFMYIYSVSRWLSPIKIILLSILGGVMASLWKSNVSNLVQRTGSYTFEGLGLPDEFHIWADIFKDVRPLEWSLGGQSYLDTAGSLLYPFLDVQPLSIWYINSYHPEIAEGGGGRAFSFLAEVFMNFGFLGVPIVYGVIGVALGVLIKASLKNMYFLYAAISLLPFMHKMFRSELLAFLKVWWWVCFIPALGLFLFHKLFSKKDRELCHV